MEPVLTSDKEFKYECEYFGWFLTSDEPYIIVSYRIGTEHEKFGFEFGTLRPMKYEQIAELLNIISERFDWEKIMEGENIIGLKQVCNLFLQFPETYVIIFPNTLSMLCDSRQLLIHGSTPILSKTCCQTLGSKLKNKLILTTLFPFLKSMML